MFGTMTNGSTWSAPVPVPAAVPAAGASAEKLPYLQTIVRRALNSSLGPPELVRWVRATAASYSADGVSDGEPLTRCVAQALGRTLARPAGTVLGAGPETWLRTA